MSVAEQFGRNLARCRRAAGLSQEDVSFLAGLHRTEVSQLERGLRLPRLDYSREACRSRQRRSRRAVRGNRVAAGRAAAREFPAV